MWGKFWQLKKKPLKKQISSSWKDVCKQAFATLDVFLWNTRCVADRQTIGGQLWRQHNTWVHKRVRTWEKSWTMFSATLLTYMDLVQHALCKGFIFLQDHFNIFLNYFSSEHTSCRFHTKKQSWFLYILNMYTWHFSESVVFKCCLLEI